MTKELAIVIPAYKADFFDQTLASIARQTCKDFTLYIGDDNSPSDLYRIVQQYEGQLDIVFRRFDMNLGGADLVSHWNRCLDMTGDEKWMWLFSDDDLMEPGCVESFYNFTSKHRDEELLHFNVDVINGANESILDPQPFPEFLNTADFFSRRIRVEIHSYAVEYIFRKDLYLKAGKFEYMDLAWSADDATWIKFSRSKGIKTIPGTRVKWRYSNANISSIVGNSDIVLRKLNASVAYLTWVAQYFREHQVTDGTTDFQKFKALFLTLIKNSSLSPAEKYKVTLAYLDKLGYSKLKPLSLCYLFMTLVKMKLFNRNLAY